MAYTGVTYIYLNYGKYLHTPWWVFATIHLTSIFALFVQEEIYLFHETIQNKDMKSINNKTLLLDL